MFWKSLVPMGKLVLTWFNNQAWRVEQMTLENVNLTADYIDELGRRTTLMELRVDDQRIEQKDYFITDRTVLRMVKGIDYDKKEN